MSDYITICLCGHERRIPAGLVGQELFCPGCKRTLVVTEDSIRPVGQAAKGNAIVPGQEPVSPIAAQFQSDDGDASSVPPVAAQFDADEDEGPPAPESEPLFAPIEEDALEPPVAAQFASADEEDLVVATVARGGDDRPREPHCDRCRKPFRGEWDRYVTADGTLCHRCANLAVERPPESPVPDLTPAMTAAQRAELARLAAENQVRMEEERAWAAERAAAEESTSFSEKYKDEIQRVVLILGVLVLVLAVTVALFDESGTPPDVVQQTRVASGESPSPEDLIPRWLYWVVRGLMAVLSFAGEFCALFFVLHWMNKLPNDTLGANLIAVGVVALGLAVFWQFPFYLFPGIGTFIRVLGPFVILYFIYKLYVLTIGELFMYILGHGLVVVAVWGTSILVFGLIGMIML